MAGSATPALAPQGPRPGAAEKTPRKHLKWVSVASAFTLLASVFGLFFVVRTPLLWGFDETSHVARAYQISQGHVRAQFLGDNRADMGFGGEVPANLLALITYVDSDIEHGGGAPHVRDAAGYAALARLGLRSPGVLYAFPNTAAYSPVAYLPAVAGIELAGGLGFDMGNTIYLARLADLAFYVGCVTCAFSVLRGTRFRWVLFAVALLPVSVFEAATVNADAVTNAVVLLLSALVIKGLFVEERLSRSEEAALFVAAVAVPLLKPLYLLLDLLILLVPAAKFRSERFAVLVKAGAVSLGFGGFAAWQVATSNVLPALGFMRPGPGWQTISPHRQLVYVLSHPLTMVVTLLRTLREHARGYVEQVFGQLSFANVNIPVISLLLSATSVLAASFALGPVRWLKRHHVLAIGGTVAATFLLIFGAEYLSWTDVGYKVILGVNGRYFVPLLVLALSVVGVVSPVRARLTKMSQQNTFAVLLVVAVAMSLVLSCARLDHALWG
jgi:uncharacterized membrane protein